MFEKFTEAAIKTVMLAQEEARLLGRNRVSSEQLLLGLIGEGRGIASQVIKTEGLQLKEARLHVAEIVGCGSDFPKPSFFSWLSNLIVSFKDMPFDEDSRQILENAWKESCTQGVDYIDTEHILLGILRSEESVAVQILRKHQLSTAALREAVMNRLQRQ